MILRAILPISRHVASSISLSSYSLPYHPTSSSSILLFHCSIRKPLPIRQYTSSADTKIEEIQELYFTARDEFEIASEETTKKTVYAADDRAAAQEEFLKLKVAYKEAVEGPEEEVGKEIQRRIGQRVRELERGMEALEEEAKED